MRSLAAGTLVSVSGGGVRRWGDEVDCPVYMLCVCTVPCRNVTGSEILSRTSVQWVSYARLGTSGAAQPESMRVPVFPGSWDGHLGGLRERIASGSTLSERFLGAHRER